MNNKGRQPDENLLSILANAPQLSDYCTPSEDQKIQEYMFVAGGAIVGGVTDIGTSVIKHVNGYWYFGYKTQKIDRK